MIALTGLMIATSGPAFAQSGSRSYPPARSYPRQPQPSTGSGPRTQTTAPLALKGYCPVSVLEMRKWVKGDPSFQVAYDGRIYRLANEQGKRMFEADPAKYVPALGGDCVVAAVKMGKRAPGSIHYGAIHSGRLFLLTNQDARQTFLASPKTYANADLALGGNCPVCRVNMRQNVPGNAEFAAYHKDLRYLFPSAEQRAQFLASPQSYVSATTGGGQPTAGSSTRQPSRGSTTRQPVRSGSGTR